MGKQRVPSIRERTARINKAMNRPSPRGSVVKKGVATKGQRSLLKKSGLGRMALKAHDKMFKIGRKGK